MTEDEIANGFSFIMGRGRFYARASTRCQIHGCVWGPNEPTCGRDENCAASWELCTGCLDGPNGHTAWCARDVKR